MKAINHLILTLLAAVFISVMCSFALSENQAALKGIHVQTKFTGIATYISKTKMSDLSDSVSQKLQTDLGPELSKQLAKAFKNAGSSEFTLRFNDKESLYKPVEKLAKPTGNSSITVQVRTGGASSMIYKNLKENIYLKKDEIMGKPFLIQDELKSQPWEMHNESKVIGGLTCYKATYTKQREKSNDEEGEGGYFFVGDSEGITITAWYTPQIPVSNGPGEYQGLPGLIMEVSDGRTTILCSEIQLNPANFEEIKRPDEGKKINQADFDELRDKKLEEYSKRKGFKKGVFIQTMEK